MRVNLKREAFAAADLLRQAAHPARPSRYAERNIEDADARAVSVSAEVIEAIFRMKLPANGESEKVGPHRLAVQVAQRGKKLRIPIRVDLNKYSVHCFASPGRPSPMQWRRSRSMRTLLCRQRTRGPASNSAL